MYESEAYEILHIKRGSSQEEIKEAYAALSKQYHPEEHPEEFQRIHEAYMTLHRRNRGRRADSQNQESEQKNATEEVSMEESEESRNQDVLEERAEPEAQSETYDMESSREYNTEENRADLSEGEAQQESAPQYNFDEVIEKNERKDEQRLILLIQKALVEMEMLLKPPYCDKFKMFQQFFQKPEYQTALKQPAFMAYFADMLTDSHLKPMIYDHIIEYYRFRGLDPKEMYEEAAKLYYVLDDKRGMKKKKVGFWQGVLPVAAIAGIRAGTRSADPGTATGNLFGFLFVVVIVIALIYILYRQLYKNHSGLFAQAIVSLLLTISQFVILMGDFYAPMMGTGAGTLLSVFLCLMGIIWLIGIGIAAIIKKIRRSSQR
ncbi:DnaJ domain-containing protein [uncultured Eubacterium sp.]|uniref:DnaJ domain-containing protein n=1 Tax=uncultured Eubacterium sp. TaxID=165185 RepID=UPI0025F1A3AA|nr:DnaJ domain-containing protein [uncultured Eubacterium sp.]